MTRTRILLLLLTLSFLLAGLFQPAAAPASSPAAIPAAGNWGLSFPTEGESPIGNATEEELAQYNACYVGESFVL